MIGRFLEKALLDWKEDPLRKPLVLRGARQTGKTTLVKQLGRYFENSVALNLELLSDRRHWEGNPSVQELLKNIEVAKGIKITPSRTLLFLDEIQNEPRAIQSLRYFYETIPNLHVIATGSLLEVALQDKGFSFPVGRVSFLFLYPLCFGEFLNAIGEHTLYDEISHLTWKTPLSVALHSLASQFFSDYLYTGGMPEVVKTYAEEKSFLPLIPIKESLLIAFEEDVPKYAKPSQVKYIQFLIRQAPLFAGQRIQYANFGNSGYPSREMRQAFETLEQALVVQRIFGTSQSMAPLQPSFTVSPKLLYLDTGLVTQKLNVEPQMLKTGDLNDLFRGTLAEQMVGQELLCQNFLKRDLPSFWYRNKPGSTAETDFAITLSGQVIPIEVKSGKSGRLRSLFQFMEQSPHPFAVRIYSGPLQVDPLETKSGKKFELISVPFYLAYHLKNILGEWIKENPV